MLEKIKSFKKIDAHSHIGVFGGWSNVAISIEELIAQMDEYNIEKTVLSTYPNDEVIDAVIKYPEKIIGAVWVNPNEKDTIKIVESAIVNYNFRGIKLHPLMHGYLPNDECVFPICELARKYDVPLMIHTGHPPYSLPWSVGQLAEVYSDIKIVMIHMGHGNGMYIQAAIDMAKKYDNLYLETSGMPMHTKIKEAYDTVGSDRIMWGLDAPFHHPTVEMQKAIVSGLTDGELEDVFYNNAKKLLKL